VPNRQSHVFRILEEAIDVNLDSSVHCHLSPGKGAFEPEAQYLRLWTLPPQCYRMSPEPMQDKTHDSESDLWSFSCLIDELCKLTPPFHEAKAYITYQRLDSVLPPFRSSAAFKADNVVAQECISPAVAEEV
jgi:hypothetical protein